MNLTPSLILCIIALILAVISFVYSGYPLLTVAVVLLAIAGLLPAFRA